MSQFVGYHIDGYSGEGRPISTGATKDAAQASAIRRVLSLCILDGEVGVQERDNLSADEFSKLREVLDAWFAGKGIQ